MRGYLVAQLESLGLDPELQAVEAPDYFSPSATTVEVVNVMARIRGTSTTGAVVLMAHYDTDPPTPGANDNSSGVAVLLETARALVAGEPLGNDVVVLFTDAEEPAPRYGSTAFVTQHPWMDDVAFVMNFEALGGSGPSIAAETGVAQAWTIDRLASATSRPVAFSFLTATVELMGEIGTDLDPFNAAGVRGLNVAYLRGSSIYHTPRDALDSVSLASVQHHGDYAVGMAHELGNMDLTETPSTADATFFTVWPGVLVRYRSMWTLPLALVAAAMAAATVAVDVRRRGLRLRAVLASATWLTLGAVGAALVAGLVWMGIAAARPEMGAGEAYLYLAGIGAAGLAMRLWLARRRSRPAPGGVVLVWAAFAVVAAVGMPGAAYLFTWPAIVAGIALVAWPAAGEVARWVRLVVVSAVTAVMVVPAVDIFLSLAQPRPGNPGSELPETFVVVGLLLVLAGELVGVSMAGVAGGHEAQTTAPAQDEPAAVAVAG